MKTRLQYCSINGKENIPKTTLQSASHELFEHTPRSLRLHSSSRLLAQYWSSRPPPPLYEYLERDFAPRLLSRHHLRRVFGARATMGARRSHHHHHHHHHHHRGFARRSRRCPHPLLLLRGSRLFYAASLLHILFSSLFLKIQKVSLGFRHTGRDT